MDTKIVVPSILSVILLIMAVVLTFLNLNFAVTFVFGFTSILIAFILSLFVLSKGSKDVFSKVAMVTLVISAIFLICEIFLLLGLIASLFIG